MKLKRDGHGTMVLNPTIALLDEVTSDHPTWRGTRTVWVVPKRVQRDTCQE
jgi:hypothetical protein